MFWYVAMKFEVHSYTPAVDWFITFVVTTIVS